MSTNQRIRGRKLQRIREEHLSDNPLCVACLAKGKIREATELDHIQALGNKGEDTDSNRQGLCKACHKEKTIKDMGYRQRPRIGSDGYPIEE